MLISEAVSQINNAFSLFSFTTNDFNTTGKGLLPALYGLNDKGKEAINPGAPLVAPLGVKAVTDDELEVPFTPPATEIEIGGKLVMAT